MKIDWSKAPKSARWWAVDKSGEAYWFPAPNVAAFTDFWFAEPVKAPTFGFDGDWKSSLVERSAEEMPKPRTTNRRPAARPIEPPRDGLSG